MIDETLDLPSFFLEDGVMPWFALDDFRSGLEDISAFLTGAGFAMGHDRAWADDLLRRSEEAEAERRRRRQAGKRAKPTFYSIDPRPFNFIDPATIPRRAWLYGTHYARRFDTRQHVGYARGREHAARPPPHAHVDRT